MAVMEAEWSYKSLGLLSLHYAHVCEQSKLKSAVDQFTSAAYTVCTITKFTVVAEKTIMDTNHFIQLQKVTVPVLKAYLKGVGVKPEGKKQDLIVAVKDYLGL